MKASDFNDNLPDQTDELQQDKLEFDVVIQTPWDGKEYDPIEVEYDYVAKKIIVRVESRDDD